MAPGLTRPPMRTVEVTALAADDGKRADVVVAACCGITRAAAQRLLEAGCVLVNGAPAAKGRRIVAGDALAVAIPDVRETEAQPQDIPLDIVYEDADVCVVDKPKGLVVHPAAGNLDGTLVNALLHHCAGSLSGIGGEVRPGIVHRIDKDTSGLLVAAKNDNAHLALAEQFAAHSITRVYNAVVYGHMPASQGTVDAPIGRSAADRKKMAVTQKNAKTAVTTYGVVAEYPGFSHLELRLQTGRTHQIRVHMAHIGHPLAGDAVYGPKKAIKALHGQCLHAGTLGFVHPKSGEYMEFTSPLPPYFTGFLDDLGRGEQ